MASKDNVTMEGVRLVFRNFAGKEGMYNREGDRNFSVLLDPDVAQAMSDDGWNVKYLRAREDGEEPQAHLPIAVSYRNRPPRVVLITSKGKTTMMESELEILDWVDVANADLIVNPYPWSVKGETGIKAYLQSLYLTVQEDELQQKYSDVPELESSGSNRAPLELEDPNVIDAEIVED